MRTGIAIFFFDKVSFLKHPCVRVFNIEIIKGECAEKSLVKDFATYHIFPENIAQSIFFVIGNVQRATLSKSLPLSTSSLTSSTSQIRCLPTSSRCYHQLLSVLLLAPQSGALRIISNPSHPSHPIPLIAFEHLSLSAVI